MYKLHAPMINSRQHDLVVVRKIFKEVLGYTDKEIDYFEKTQFCCDVAINLTLEQAQQITQIFLDNDIQIYLGDQATNKSLFWTKDLGIIIPKNPPKSHYCDEPLVSRDHLVDAFTEQEKERQHNIEEARREEREKALTTKSANIPKCPTCGSTNVHKISTGKKALGFVTVGIFSSNFGKTMHCKNCGYKF